MNVPLGLAITELIAETNIPTIAHHHDFSWERTRYAVNAAEDYIQAAFPPAMSTIYHVVINSFGARQLAFRTGMTSKLIPNVMDFDNPPLDSDEYAEDLREDLELAPDDLFLLQPTRIVPRKRIERAIELARWLETPCALVISHSAGDEGYDYQAYLKDYAQAMGVRVIFSEDIFAYERQHSSEGKKVYSLRDAYQQADLVTYPSSIEGFGNAFLETIYYRRPLMMCSYDIFKADISPKGFQVIVFDEFITRLTVEHTRSLLKNPSQIQKIVESNYELGKKYYSYTVLRKYLDELIEQCFQ
jgi:glycosyltransferase involved in cell wall biosynthesis